MTPQIRPATRADAAAVGAFLHAHMNGKIAPEVFARILDYGWEGAPGHRGMLAQADGAIVGYHGSVGSARWIDGLARPCGSFSSLYVHKSARGHNLGEEMMRALVGMTNVTYTVFNPSSRVQDLLERCGFVDLDDTRYVFFGQDAAGPVQISRDPGILARLIDRRILEDHVGMPVDPVVLSDRDGEAACILSAPARTAGGSAVELLHVSDPAGLARMIAAAAPLLLGHDRDLRLHADARYFDGHDPGGRHTPLPYRRMIRPAAAALPLWRVDHLYSETLLLDLKLG
ncbi:MAG: GNAT family N-acetyltransferase [Pseudomonadota bacterium]